jgi:O-antigen ligase
MTGLGRLFQTRWPVVGLGAALFVNAFLATRVANQSGLMAIGLALFPVFAVLIGVFAVSHRDLLVYLALGINMSLAFFTSPLSGRHVYVSDLIAALALASWSVARLLGLKENAHGSKAATVGWPFTIFAVAMLQAIVRGHYDNGLQFLSGPTRLLFYAAIAFALTDTEPRRLYRGIVWTFYLGTAWQFVVALYNVATGRSETNQVDLSTGGVRYVSLAVAVYFSCALFLALLNLQVDHAARKRFLHLAVAAMATVGVVLAFGRSSFLAVGVVVPLLVILTPSVRNALLGLLPLCLPFIALIVIFAPQAVPHVGHNLFARLTASPTNDINVRWRAAASKAVLQQVKESPITGVGFGRDTNFIFDYTTQGVPIHLEQTVDQDPHDGYLYLLAGGGIIALVGFLLVIAAYTRQAWQALRVTRTPEERVLVTWSALALFAFLMNTASGLALQSPSAVLTIWTLLVLPSVVLAHDRAPVERSERPLRAVHQLG